MERKTRKEIGGERGEKRDREEIVYALLNLWIDISSGQLNAVRPLRCFINVTTCPAISREYA